jgi:heme/copper-type cytochrome/quinol oxidase subunit 3
MQTTFDQDEKRRLRAEREAAMRLKNNKLGLTIFQASWILVFVALVIVYWQLGFTEGWRPSAEQKPGFVWPTLATLLLLASTYFARSALQHLKQQANAGSISTFQSRWLAAIGCGVLFLVIMIQQALTIANPNSTNYEYVDR